MKFTQIRKVEKSNVDEHVLKKSVFDLIQYSALGKIFLNSLDDIIKISSYLFPHLPTNLYIRYYLLTIYQYSERVPIRSFKVLCKFN